MTGGASSGRPGSRRRRRPDGLSACSCVVQGEGEGEYRTASAWRGGVFLRPQAAAVEFDDRAADRQADPHAFLLGGEEGGVQLA